MNDLTIAYFSNRLEPKWDWFFNSLRRELNNSSQLFDFEILIIDYWSQFHPEARAAKLNDCIPKDRPWNVHLSPPKPCVWQGYYKLTKNEYFAASNARNTAFCLASAPYVACVDDLSVLMPGWLDNMLHAAQNKYVVMGAYEKVNNLACDGLGKVVYDLLPPTRDAEGKIVNERPGRDSRWGLGSDAGIVKAQWAMLFGCSFGVPLEKALEVNGFEEQCDGQGAEDYDFGLRLHRAGAEMFYNRNIFTVESEEMHHTPGNQKFIRELKMMPFNGETIGSDHVMLRRVQNEERTNTIAQYSNLREIRKSLKRGDGFVAPKEPALDWRDGQPLAEM